MRMFKIKPKGSPDLVKAPHSPQTREVLQPPVVEDVIDIDALMASTDERDDAAPIGSIAAQDVDFKDVAVSKEAEASKGDGLFSKFKRKPKSSPEPEIRAAVVVDTKEAVPSAVKSRVSLKWPSRKSDASPNAAAASVEGRADASAFNRSSGQGGQESGLPEMPLASPELSPEAEASPESPATPGKAAYVPASDEVAGSRFARMKAKFSRGADDFPVAAEVPIRVLIGYLPEVSERDALEFAQGIASKHVENLGLAYFDAFKADSGYAYEVHEGGAGRAYLPEILKYYRSLGAFNPEDDNAVVLRTGTRAVEVSRARAGVSAVLLPETQKPATPPWLRATTAMRPALNKRTGVLVAGAVMFVTGFVAALAAGAIFRIQPYEAPVPTKIEQIDYTKLPYSQWQQLNSGVDGGKYVKALKFEKGNWRIETESVDAAKPAEPVAPGSTPAQPSN